MKNKYITAIVLTAMASGANAVEKSASSDLKVTLGGSIDTQLGYRQQKSFFENTFHKNSDIGSGEAHKTAIVNNTKLTVNVEGKSGHGFKYGGYLKLNADTSNNIITGDDNIAEKVYAYLECNKRGRLEVGGNDSASSQMAIGAQNIAKATGGVDGNTRKWISQYAYYPTPDLANAKFKKMSTHFLNSPGLPADIDYDEYVSKITYFTPKFHGLQFGMSYLIDTDLHGTVAVTHQVAKEGDEGFKNIYTPSVKYETKLNDMHVEAALGAQFGEAKTKSKHKIKAWQLGALAKYKGFGVAGSYGDWGKSGAPKVKESGRKYGTKYWTAGASYEKNAFGTSLTYMETKSANTYTDVSSFQGIYKDLGFNRYEQLTLSLEYKLAQGLMPYVEVSNFKAKQSGAKLSNKGSVFLVGSKLSF